MSGLAVHLPRNLLSAVPVQCLQFMISTCCSFPLCGGTMKRPQALREQGVVSLTAQKRGNKYCNGLNACQVP